MSGGIWGKCSRNYTENGASLCALCTDTSFIKPCNLKKQFDAYTVCSCASVFSLSVCHRLLSDQRAQSCHFWNKRKVVCSAVVLLLIDVRNVFLRFFIPVTFLTFLTFFILSTFFIFYKTFIENSIKKFEKHFWSHSNELIGLDFILYSSSVSVAYRDDMILR